MAYVRTLVQQCKPGTVEMLTRKAEQTLVPRLREIPGFISYQVARIDDRSLIATGIFETPEGVDRLQQLGAEWRRDIGKDAIVSIDVHIGEILLDAKPEPRDATPRERSTGEGPRASHPSVF